MAISSVNSDIVSPIFQIKNLSQLLTDQLKDKTGVYTFICIITVGITWIVDAFIGLYQYNTLLKACVDLTREKSFVSYPCFDKAVLDMTFQKHLDKIEKDTNTFSADQEIYHTYIQKIREIENQILKSPWETLPKICADLCAVRDEYMKDIL